MEVDIAIVGGGLAGASLAVALRKTRFRIALLEVRTPAFTDQVDHRVYAVSPINQSFLEGLGVWQHMDALRLSPVHDMEVQGDAGGVLRFSAHDAGLKELAWIIESSVMHRELWETVRRQHNVSVLCPAQCTTLQVNEDSAQIELDNGRRLHARLVVGADGVNSWVREQVGITAMTTPYDEHGVVANFECELPHHGVAYQWFRPDGILALLPMMGRTVSMVWSADDALARELVQLPPDELQERVTLASQGVLGNLRQLNCQTGFPLRFMRVSQMVKPRVALLGDAAHAIHPLSGHGINLGYQDARALAEVLSSLPEWADPGALSGLRRYARSRAEEPAVLQYSTHGLQRLFGLDNAALAPVRNLGMNLLGRLPVLKHALVRYATSGHF